MKPEHEPFDPALERAIQQIHDEPVDHTVIEAAAKRVWGRISAELKPSGGVIRGCSDFQALIPDYVSGRLPESSALLLKDHTQECVSCRKLLHAASGRVVEMKTAPAQSVKRPATRHLVRWTIAAALTLGVGFTSWNVVNTLPAPNRAQATVEWVGGAAYQVSSERSVPLQPGQVLRAGTEIRTGKDSGAILRLTDGSVVEMRENSGFSVSATRRDLTVRLGRGAVIVEAAKQQNGHLFVATADCKVSVTGTVFSVNTGIKGSRVSVVEGEVLVAQNRQEKVLRPGEQFSTSETLTPVPIEEEIAWSRKVDQHIALLRELTNLRKELEQIRPPELRYSSRLLDSVPAETVIYASIPNIGQTLEEAHRIFEAKVAESPVLREWYQQQLGHNRAGFKFGDMIHEFRALSDYLGDEIVLVAPMTSTGDVEALVALAEVKRPGLREFAQAEMTRFGIDPGHVQLRFVDSSAAIGQPAKDEVVVFLRPDVVAVSPDVHALRQVASALEGNSRFAGTPFHARLQQAYRDGAGMLFSADLERITAARPFNQGAAETFVLGNVRHIVLEQKDVNGQTNTRAVFGFAGQRSGIASWLDRPATLGALDFISPDVTAVSGFILRTPATIVEELFSTFQSLNPGFQQNLKEAEAELGIDIRRDIVSSLGSEVAFALDGPAFPVPSWKLVVTVYDPARLQAAIERQVEAMDRLARSSGNSGFTLTQDSSSGRTYHIIKSESLKNIGEINYTFVDGYLLAGSSRMLIDKALEQRQNGYTLTRSTKFRSLIPRDGYPNFSALIYHDLGSALAPIIEGLSSSVSLLPEQRSVVDGIANDMKPLLIGLYAEDDQITVASTSSTLSLSAANLLRMHGPMDLATLLRMKGTRGDGAAYR